MKKTSKIVFLVVLSVILMFTFSVKVHAADEQTQIIDVTEYEDLDAVEEKSEEEKNDGTTPENTDKSDNAETEDAANQATTQHPQTGVFNNSICIAIAVISISMVLAYTKFKKYNF